MAERALAINRWPGRGAAALVAALIAGTILAVAFRAEAARGLGAADWAKWAADSGEIISLLSARK